MGLRSIHNRSPTAEELASPTAIKPVQRVAPKEKVVQFRYDPYNTQTAQVPTKLALEPIPAGTLHGALHGKMVFVSYPTESFYCEPPRLHKSQMARVFLGQLPYGVTNMQLDWLTNTFAGVPIYYPERIVKHDEEKDTKVPTGCIHAYCDPELVPFLEEAMHKRILVDDTGVWYASTPAEKVVLDAYVKTMKKNRRKRFTQRPYDTVVVQLATSTFVPKAVLPPYPF